MRWNLRMMLTRSLGLTAYLRLMCMRHLPALIVHLAQEICAQTPSILTPVSLLSCLLARPCTAIHDHKPHMPANCMF